MTTCSNWPLVDLYKAEIAPVHDFEIDVFADQPFDQVPQFVENIGDVENSRLQRLLSRKGQQLPHEIGGAVRILLDLHDVREGRVARRRAQQQQIAKPDHRGQQVVEIVGDAAGKLPNGLHLLRLRELDFEVLLLGDVDEMEGKPLSRLHPRYRHRGEAPIPGVVEAAEEQDQSLIARPHWAGPPPARDPPPPGQPRRAWRQCGRGPSSFTSSISCRPLRHLRCGAEQLTDRAVHLLKAPGAVEQCNPHGGVGETTTKAFERSEGSLPLALGGQIAHD